jgi:CubicO group peptidase (beta-lactamase class C family)
MTQSEPAITNDIRHRLAVGYGPVHDDRPWSDGDALAPATWLETDTADGSVAATGPDLAAFVRWLMTDATGIVAQMATPVVARAAYGYGMALLPRLIDGRHYLGHGGGMVGYLAGMQWDPEAGLGAVVLQNGPLDNPNSLARLAIRQVRAMRDGRDPAIEGMEGPTDLDETPDVDAIGPGVPDLEQAVLVGTYRSHDPWIPVFAIEARGPELWLTFPEGPDGFDDAQPLLPMARGWFRVGADRLGPERIRFDTVIDGRARRAWLSGWDYYRIR